ncbi:MAG: photosynthetic complex putative assembly protein PuhB, partial [Pararhodobacter sp.]
MSHDDFAFEPQEGLPQRLPQTEVMLWQGRPSAWALFRDVYGMRWIAGYFAVVVVWRAAAGWLEGGFANTLAMSIPYMVLGGLALVIMGAMAWVAARSTVYSVTTARVVMRIGAALTVTLNLPYRQIGNASLDLRRDGTGTVAFDTLGETRFSYLILWPHLRPWHVSPTQPALRCSPDAARVARLIAEAAEARMSEPVLAAINIPVPRRPR